MKNITELNPHNHPITAVIGNNLKTLFERLIEFQDACEMDFIITSGLRSDAEQLDLIAQGKTNAKHSKHCAGLAADIYDPDKELAKWVLDNIDFVTKTGLWFEDFAHTKNWVHAQCTAPLSGKRIFIP